MGCLYQFWHRLLSGTSLLIADTQQVFDCYTTVSRRFFREQNVWDASYTLLNLVRNLFDQSLASLYSCVGVDVVEWVLKIGVALVCPKQRRVRVGPRKVRVDELLVARPGLLGRRNSGRWKKSAVDAADSTRGRLRWWMSQGKGPSHINGMVCAFVHITFIVCEFRQSLKLMVKTKTEVTTRWK